MHATSNQIDIKKLHAIIQTFSIIIPWSKFSFQSQTAKDKEGAYTNYQGWQDVFS